MVVAAGFAAVGLPQLAFGRCWLAAVGFAAAGFHDPYIRGMCV